MGTKYLVDHDELVNIADAIRNKSKKTGSMSIGEMPEKIAELQAEEILTASSYNKKTVNANDPYYIYNSALDIVNKVNNIRKPDSIVFIAMSDSHYPASQSNTSDYVANKKSSIQANQIAKALTYMLDIDFFAHLGDVGTGAQTTTPDTLQEQITEFTSLFTEANSDLPLFIAIGNHDNGIYYQNGLQTLINEYNTLVAGGKPSEANAKASTLIERCPDVIDLGIIDGLRKFDISKMKQSYCFSGQFMYDNFTAHSASANTVMGDQTYGGYCYRDFTSKYLRVFLLNTSEESTVTSTEAVGLTGNQKKWFADALIDLNTSKPEWSFIVLSHIPADYGSNMPLSELLKAYVAGETITITPETGSSKTYEFNGKNTAQFAGQFHGHIHNFKTSRLHTKINGTVTPYDAHRICVSNVQFNRENSYADVGGIDFSDNLVYGKAVDTKTGTSFVVNVITPSEKKIYSFCVGAGFDRAIKYGKGVYYNITFTSETGTVFSHSISDSILEETPYSTTLIAQEGLKLSTAKIKVLMGETDITEQCYTYNADGTGSIYIENVTGDIIITADAYDRSHFTVTYDLINVSCDNEIEEIPNESTERYTATIQPINNLVIKNIAVYMGKEDVSTQYIINNNGIYTINITNITDDIKISANAPASNLWLIAQSKTDSSIYNNGLGYANNYRLGGNGVYFDSDSTTDEHAQGLVTTGLIPYPSIKGKLPPTLEIKGADLDFTHGYVRSYWHNADKTYRGGTSDAASAARYWDIEERGTQHYILTPKWVVYDSGPGQWWAGSNGTEVHWIRFTLIGSGENLTIRDISNERAVYTVDYNVNGLHITNSAQAAYGGLPYNAYISDTAYRSLSGVPIVKMKDVDITSSALSDDLRTIAISDVTGNISIMADSVLHDNNMLKTSIDTDGTIYNGTGYKSNTYLSGAAVGTRNGIYTSGFIPVKQGDIVYFKNCTMMAGNSNHRICSYKEDKTFITENRFSANVLTSVGIPTYDENGYLVSILLNHSQWSNAAYLRFCCSYLGSDSIVTVNKPIK